jgi:hypothetical protein
MLEAEVSDVETAAEWPADVEHHRIEGAVKVWLVWRGGRWVADWANFGEPLETAYDRAVMNEGCECGEADRCAAAMEPAAAEDMPTGHQLLALLAEAVADYEVSSRRTDELPGVPTSDWSHPVTGNDLPELPREEHVQCFATLQEGSGPGGLIRWACNVTARYPHMEHQAHGADGEVTMRWTDLSAGAESHDNGKRRLDG